MAVTAEAALLVHRLLDSGPMKPATALLLRIPAIVATGAPSARAQTAIDCHSCKEWNTPRATLVLFGGSHYVGTEGLSVVAIDTGAGVILIDGALPQSVDGIVANLRALADGESITLGDTTLTLHATPGHTPGGASWSWREDELERCIRLVFADSLNPVSDEHYRFSEGKRADTFRASIATIRALPCDLLVSAHPGFSRLFERQSQSALIDRDACTAYADDAARRLDQRLGQEREAPSTP